MPWEAPVITIVFDVDMSFSFEKLDASARFNCESRIDRSRIQVVEVVAHRRQSDADREFLQGGGVVAGSEEIPLGAFRSEAPSRNESPVIFTRAFRFRMAAIVAGAVRIAFSIVV